MKLYGADVCPFVHRARLTLAEKALEHEYVAIDLRDKPDWYHQVLPSGKVPLLEHNGHRIWESAIVCEYLEEAFPEKSLLPSEPGLKAQARIWIDWVSTALVPAFYKLLKAQDEKEQEEHKNALTEALEKLEKDGFQEGSWILGDSLSLVDLETYPWFERWCVLEHYRKFGIPQKCTKLRAWRERMEKREAVMNIAERPAFYIGQYSHYAKPQEEKVLS